MGVLAQKIKKAPKVEKATKEVKESKKLDKDSELKSVLEELAAIEDEFGIANLKVKEATAPIRKALGLDELEEKKNKIEERKNLIVKELISYIKSGGKSSYKYEEKEVQSKTPQYKSICTDYIDEEKLEEALANKKYYTSKVEKKLLDEDDNDLLK